MPTSAAAIRARPRLLRCPCRPHALHASRAACPAALPCRRAPPPTSTPPTCRSPAWCRAPATSRSPRRRCPSPRRLVGAAAVPRRRGAGWVPLLVGMLPVPPRHTQPTATSTQPATNPASCITHHPCQVPGLPRERVAALDAADQLRLEGEREAALAAEAEQRKVRARGTGPGPGRASGGARVCWPKLAAGTACCTAAHLASVRPAWL